MRTLAAGQASIFGGRPLEWVNNDAVVYLPRGLYGAGPVAAQQNWLGEIQCRTTRRTPACPNTELPDRLATHLTRHAGPSVEFADIRAYVPGDQLRTVNWPVSARSRSLHVTERLTDRAADVVVLIDTHAQPPRPPIGWCAARCR